MNVCVINTEIFAAFMCETIPLTSQTEDKQTGITSMTMRRKIIVKKNCVSNKMATVMFLVMYSILFIFCPVHKKIDLFGAT